MKKNIKLLMIVCGLICALTFLVDGCSLLSVKPGTNASLYCDSIKPQRNIGKLSGEIRNYYKSGNYNKDLNAVAGQAVQCLKSYDFSELKGKPAIVLDIDETCLSNYGYDDYYNFGYSSRLWANWIKKGSLDGGKYTIETIKPTLELSNLARKLGVTVFFVTGARDPLRIYTIRNLKKAGYVFDDKNLIMKPNNAHFKSAADYKTPQREKIEEKGYRIIINLGDQCSDLKGGYAEHTFKYPNPFYYVP